MAKAKRYAMEQVRAAQKTLRGLAVKNAGKTRTEVIEFLADDIRKAAQQGYGLKEIREVLGEAGIAAPLSKMRALLGETDGGPVSKVASEPGGGGVSPFSPTTKKGLAAREDRDGQNEDDRRDMP